MYQNWNGWKLRVDHAEQMMLYLFVPVYFKGSFRVILKCTIRVQNIQRLSLRKAAREKKNSGHVSNQSEILCKKTFN